MGFRLVPKSLTLNDLERCNSSWKLALETSANFVATRAGNSRWNLARVSGSGFQREFPASVS